MYEDVLASVPLLCQLSRRDLARLGKAVVPRTYRKGEVVVKEGDPAAGFFIIVKGQVEVLQGLEGSKPKKLATLGPGEFFGEMALLDGYPRMASVRVVEDAEFLVLSRWDFLAELRTNAHMAVSMLPVLSKRLREAEAAVSH